jgi:hypothetical protein
MKRFALLPALFALLLAAVLTGAAFAQQAPPGPTSPQAGDMIPDASTIAAFAARSATAHNIRQAGDMITDASTFAAFAARSATAHNIRQAGDIIPDASTIAAFAARSATAHNMPQAGNMIPDASTIAAFAARSANVNQTKDLAQGSRTAQLAPAHFDDSIEAPQTAAAMQAMAAIHVPSMEAIRLALASAKAAREQKSQEQRLQDPTLATPTQSAQTAQLAPAQYDSPGGLVTLAQATELGLPALAAAEEVATQSAQTAQSTSSHYAALGTVTSAQARALGLPALAGIKEMAEERYLMAILQNPTLLALVLAEEASQSQHVGPTVGELASLASAESEHEATESPVEAAFEAAEAAHNPGVSMLAPSRATAH